MRQRDTTPRPIQALIDAFTLPDLRLKLFITLLILVCSRIIAHVPLPGVDFVALNKIFENNQLLGMLDMFSGGAMKNFSVGAMWVYPYITSSIVMQLLLPIIPKLREMAQEGESGRQRLNRWTHWLTIPLAALQGYAQIALMRSQGVMGQVDGLTTATIIISLTAGTIFLVWLGELITERGIGNGVSILIFGGIVAGYGDQIRGGVVAAETNLFGVLGYVLLALVLIVLIVIFTEAHRRIPVQYAKTAFKGQKMYRQSGSTHIPLRVNTAGMIPLIFAISIMVFPGTVASYFAAPSGQDPNFANTIVEWLSPNTAFPKGLVYQGIYFLMVIGFTFFYTMVTFEQMNIPDTLQKQGGFIPGIRPGKPTTEYLNKVINRLTWGGALYLGVVAIFPFLMQVITNTQVMTLSSTGLLIVVGVALDTMKQIEAQLTMRRYEGFLK
jgi:preprotein translocase subunit SecY